ncbi:MAG: hypothetical protein C4519_18765 [Desulfobacteraceae bacterium]|nr:MAG: hypothetical protein C4519_18765 [Desulfobacteraceae bacterium]
MFERLEGVIADPAAAVERYGEEVIQFQFELNLGVPHLFGVVRESVLGGDVKKPDSRPFAARIGGGVLAGLVVGNE